MSNHNALSYLALYKKTADSVREASRAHELVEQARDRAIARWWIDTHAKGIEWKLNEWRLWPIIEGDGPVQAFHHLRDEIHRVYQAYEVNCYVPHLYFESLGAIDYSDMTINFYDPGLAIDRLSSALCNALDPIRLEFGDESPEFDKAYKLFKDQMDLEWQGDLKLRQEHARRFCQENGLEIVE